MNRNNSTPEEGNHSTKSEEQKKRELLERSATTSRVASSSSLRQWSSYRDPRIVRASRAFGGKDRHSKVCTVRGLRDRRIRLSVPTALELYDLQEKLGVSQPSKVIDWLLDATKQDIDKLPPLQMPLGFHQQMFGNNNLPTSHSFFPIRVNDNFGGGDETLKGKEVVAKENVADEKGKSIEVNDLQKNQLYAQSFFPMPYAFNQWDHPSNFSNMAQFGSNHGFQLQTENLFNPNSNFPPCPSNYLTPDSSRQMNHFQFMNAGSSILPTPFMPSIHPPMRSFQKNAADQKFLHHQGNDRSDEDR